MKITKCDLCKKEIDSEPIIVLGSTLFSKIELCQECAEPITEFLKKKELIGKQEDN